MNTMKIHEDSDVQFDDFMCGACEANDIGTSLVQSSEIPDVASGEATPPKIHPDFKDLWDKCQKEALAIKRARENAETFLGCSDKCSMGQHCVRTCRAATCKEPAFNDASKHIAMSNQSKMSLNILTLADHGSTSVMNVEDKMVWVQIPCAVDSGACAHVVPPNVFGIQNIKEAQHKGKYFGADGTPIDEFGQLTINAVLDEGSEMKTTFDVAKITRPLLSVNQITQNGHQVIFGLKDSYIKLMGSSKRIPMRAEGRLYMLDMWVKIPASLAEKSPFVRQVTQA